MKHLTREELIQWRDSPHASDRTAVLDHLAACGSCSARLAEMIRTPPIGDQPAYVNPPGWVARGNAVRRDTGFATGGLFSWKMWVGALGAAAIVSLVALLAPRPSNEVRGPDRIEIVSAPESGPETRLKWTTTLGATQFQVMLKDETGAVVFGIVTKETTAEVPAEVAVRLQPGHSYTWTVTALNPNAEPLTSATRTFSVGGAR